MIKQITKIVILIFSTNFCFGQKSTTEFPINQRVALLKFLSTNQNYKFIPETWVDVNLLKEARNEWGFGSKFKPYYQTADFNKDKLIDFAVLLIENSKSERCVVVVFNGQKNKTFKVAHLEHEDYNTSKVITYQNKKLNVMVFETEDVGCFIPTKNGYIVEPCQ